MLRVLVLGSAAGGGFPQWNCNDPTAQRARSGDLRVPPRTQSSVAVSADGRRWVVLNASPDLRQQINERRQLHPAADEPLRASPISAVVLTSGDVDCVTGLLSLRESQPLVLHAHERVLGALARNPIFNVLNPRFVSRRALTLEDRAELTDSSGAALGLTLRAFAVPGKIALWLEDPSADELGTSAGDSIGLEVSTPDSPSLFFIPGCAAMTPALTESLRGAALVFFDGTLWRDDEMIVNGVGTKTGHRMGHMSCSGPEGAIASFTELGVRRKVFIHINNTNPLLAEDSQERSQAEAAGWEVGYDGMEITL
jgi:pyrroloquinoline quinone biosynthesis protein B